MPQNSKSHNNYVNNAFSPRLIAKSWVIPTGFRKTNPFKFLITYLIFFGLLTAVITFYSVWTYYDISLPLSPPSSEISSYRETGTFSEFPIGDEKWTSVISDEELISSPILVKDVIYVVMGRTSGQGRIKALNAFDGSLLWEYALQGVSDFSPVVADEMIFISLRSGLVQALDRHNGRFLWSFQAESFMYGPPIIEEGILYLASVRIYALDAATGEVRWTQKVPKDVSSKLVLSEDVLAFVGFDGAVKLLNASNGKPKLEYSIWFPITDGLVASDSRLVVGGGNAHVFAIDMQSVGLPFERIIRSWWARLWLWGMAPSPSTPRGYLWHNSNLQGVESNPFTVDKDFVYVGTKDSKLLDSGGKIVALGIDDGKFRWKTSLDSFPISAQLVGQGGLLVATKSGQLHFLSKNSGFPTHKVESGFSLGAPPGIGRNQLIVVNKSGVIRSLK